MTEDKKLEGLHKENSLNTSKKGESTMSTDEKEQKRATRREFIKGAAVGAAAVAGAGALASCAGPQGGVGPQGPAGPAGTAGPAGIAEIKWDKETDVVVVGSGNGGLSTGIAAAKAGAKVIIVEISSKTGGGSAWSGGYIHASGLKTVAEYLEKTQGLHDSELGPFYFEKFQEYKTWLGDIGADVSPHTIYIGDLWMGQGPTGQRGVQTHCREYFDSMVSIFKGAGGTILLKTRALKILTDEKGEAVGLKAKGPEGALNIKAKAVVLACGGFQNNPELRQKYLGPEADLAQVGGVPYNMGDGMSMAQEVGASLSGGMSTFSTFSGPAHPCRNPVANAEEYEAAGFDFDGKNRFGALMGTSVPGGKILVNLDGKRYVNETAAYPRDTNVTVRQPKATGIAIFDGPMWDAIADVAGWNGRTGQDSLQLAVEYGGIVLIADTISELADKLEKLPTPVHKANFLKTIDEYNKAVRDGTTMQLEVARSGAPVEIKTPPFHAIALTPWIYACFGGLAINKYAQVLDMQKEPIPGLYACPPTAGGIMRSIYTGMIGCAGTFGWIAGQHAAAL